MCIYLTGWDVAKITSSGILYSHDHFLLFHSILNFVGFPHCPREMLDGPTLSGLLCGYGDKSPVPFGMVPTL